MPKQNKKDMEEFEQFQQYMNSKKQNVVDDDISSESEESEIEISKNITKKGKPKKEYILTEARKRQFELARQKRMENIQKINMEKEEFKKQKDELKRIADEKKKLKQEKQIKKLKKEIESESEEEIIIKKTKKPKKKIVYVESDDSDVEIVKKEKKSLPPKQTPQQPEIAPPRQIRVLPQYL